MQRHPGAPGSERELRGHRYVTKAAYVVLGIATDGRKDVKQVAADLKKIYTSVSVRQRMG